MEQRHAADPAFAPQRNLRRHLAEAGGWELGHLETRRFSDGESCVRILSDVADRQVDLVCTFARPDDSFLRLAFAAETSGETGLCIGIRAKKPEHDRSRAFVVMFSVELGWLNVLRRYLVAMALGNLIWEFAHMPLYTLWETGSSSEIVFAALHCTGGDILIATSALLASLFLLGSNPWPEAGYGRVGLATILIGLGYTVFSEWLNIEVREAWAYRDLMPIIPVIDAGLSPIAQWIVLPIIAFWWAAPRKELP